MKKRFMNNSGSFVFKTKRALTPCMLERASYFILVFKRFLILLGYHLLLHDQR